MRTCVIFGKKFIGIYFFKHKNPTKIFITIIYEYYDSFMMVKKNIIFSYLVTVKVLINYH